MAGIFGGFSESQVMEENADVMLDEDAEMDLREMMVYDELCQKLATDDERAAFLESEEADALLETGIVSKKTLVRLSKKDDLSRRKKLVVFQMAKEANDPMYKQLIKLRKKEKVLIGKLYIKYSGRATKQAAMSQKSYLKGNRLVSLNFIKDKNLDNNGNRIGRSLNNQGFRTTTKK